MLFWKIVPAKILKYCIKVWKESIPVSSNLDLTSVRSEELYIIIYMVKQRYYETPCGISFLNFKELMLKKLEIVRRCKLSRCVGLQDELEEVSDRFQRGDLRTTDLDGLVNI